MANDEYKTHGLFRRVVPVERGGPGSGHFAHEGRLGEVGGSLPSGEVADQATPQVGGVVRLTRANINDFIQWSSSRYNELRKEDVVRRAYHILNGDMWVVAWAPPEGTDPVTYFRQQVGSDNVRIRAAEPLAGKSRVEVLVRREVYDSGTYTETSGGTSYGAYLVNGEEGYIAKGRGDDPWDFEEAERRYFTSGAVERGGPTSGFYGHAGRPGEVGGSTPGDQVAMPSTDIAQLVVPEDIASGKVTISPEDALLGQPIQRIENTVYGTGYTTEDYLQLAQHVMDEQPEAFRQFMAQVEQALEDGTSTMEAYYDPETDEWTPERRLLHDQIVNDILEPGRPAPLGTEPEAVIMGGLPGSGKSSVLAERAASGQFDGYVHVDADTIKGMLPEYEGWNAALLHDESSAIVEQIFHRCTERHLPVMYDTTLRSATSGEGIITALEDVGYNTRLIYVDVPIEESMRRVLSRFASGTGRYVSPFYVATHDGRNLLNWEALKGQVDAWEHWDNGQPQGQRPTLIAQGNRRQA